MRVIAFGASNSRRSINKQLAVWAAKQTGTEVKELDLNDFEMPIYSIDREKEEGIPGKASEFKAILDGADGIIISFAEHNGSYSAAFKNIMDWVSRVERPLWSNKPMFLLATSPGARGAKGVLETASMSFPHMGGQVVAKFSLPSFSQNFNDQSGIIDDTLKAFFNQELENFNQKLDETKNKTTTAST